MKTHFFITAAWLTGCGIIQASSLTGFDAAAIVIDTTAISGQDGVWTVQKTGNTLELAFKPDRYAAWIANYPGIADPGEDADPDGDGWSNRDEWIAGTDPTNPASRFVTTVSGTGSSDYNSNQFSAGVKIDF